MIDFAASGSIDFHEMKQLLRTIEICRFDRDKVECFVDCYGDSKGINVLNENNFIELMSEIERLFDTN